MTAMNLPLLVSTFSLLLLTYPFEEIQARCVGTLLMTTQAKTIKSFWRDYMAAVIFIVSNVRLVWIF
jgi:hypothetical protein